MEIQRPFVVQKPLWGMEEIIVNRKYCGKKLHILEGYRFSMQYHKKKEEAFYVDEGKILLELGDEGDAEYQEEEFRKMMEDEVSYENENFLRMVVMNPGDIIIIPRSTWHRCGSLEGTSIITEISTHHEDSDTYKLENAVLGVTNKIPLEIMRKYNSEK